MSVRGTYGAFRCPPCADALKHDASRLVVRVLGNEPAFEGELEDCLTQPLGATEAMVD